MTVHTLTTTDGDDDEITKFILMELALYVDGRDDDYQTHGLIPGITKALVFVYDNGPIPVGPLADMAGGQVRVDIPSDWTVDPGYIEVREGTRRRRHDFLYITDGDGDVIDNG